MFTQSREWFWLALHYDKKNMHKIVNKKFLVFFKVDFPSNSKLFVFMLDSNIKFEKMFRFIHGSEIYFYNQFHIINKENWERCISRWKSRKRFYDVNYFKDFI